MKIELYLRFAATLLAFGFASADDVCEKLEHLDYELFGTKTIYGDALKYISRKKDIPHSFDDDSLEKEHQDLLEDGCKPVVFYFIGRHSARYPDGEDIDHYNQQLTELRNSIKNQPATGKCPDKFKSIVDWTPKMKYKHDNLITHLGANEERNISRRFKKVYPEFFDASKADIDVGVTGKLRTAQTGIEFLKEVDGLRLPNCDFKSLPSNDVDAADYSLEKIYDHPCFNTLMEKNRRLMLEFHKTCEKIGGKPKTKHPFVERVKRPEVVRDIAKNVAKKLGLPKESRRLITPEVLDSIWNMCKFENAMRDESVWCPLFEKDDVKALEYIEDVSTYIKSAYGPDANTRQACPLVKHLIETFQEGLKLTGERNEKRKAYFYFSHADPLKRLLGAFGMFKDDDSFSEERIHDFEKDLKVPKDRDWRSSVVSPFSGNLAFTLYRCQKPGKTVKHKVLATVTEQPVKLGGCGDTHCSTEKFFGTYEGMKNCDMSQICGRRSA